MSNSIIIKSCYWDSCERGVHLYNKTIQEAPLWTSPIVAMKVEGM